MSRLGSREQQKGELPRDRLLFLLVLFVPVLYTLFTSHVWEDFFITFRCSTNWIDGHGFVYNPGERVQAFSSPLTALLLGLFYFLTGRAGYVPALEAFRVLSIVLFGSAGIILFRLLRQNRIPAWGQFGFLLLYVLEIKTIAFVTNGMETGLVLFFLALTFSVLLSDISQKWLFLGIGGGGLLLSRADGVVFFAVTLAASLMCNSKLRTQFSALLKGGTLAGVIYLPWILWSWHYYGSPIPQTAIAKAVPLILPSAGVFLQQLFYLSANAYYPIYVEFGGWPLLIRYPLQFAGLICLGYWLLPIRDRFGRTTSLIFFLICLYFSFIMVFPWYVPPLTLFGSLTLVSCVLGLNQRVSGRWIYVVRTISCIFLTTLFGTLLFILIHSFREMKIQQTEVETGNRIQIGEWLRQNVKKDEIVYLEPIGYIGYFSQAKIRDYPGITSPDVVRLRNEKKVNYLTAIPFIQPDWIVLRLRETKAAAGIPAIRQNYAFAKSFSAADRLQKYENVPGAPYLYYDAVFLVLKKKH